VCLALPVIAQARAVPVLASSAQHSVGLDYAGLHTRIAFVRGDGENAGTPGPGSP
jgi:hypothetical protein